MKIKYFAWLKEITKNDEEFFVNNKINSVNKLKEHLINKYRLKFVCKG